MRKQHVLKIFGMFLDDLLELFDSNDKLIRKSPFAKNRTY